MVEEEPTAETDAMSNDCSDSSPGGKCETECVHDNHDAPGLVCMHGGGDEAVLGCDGFDLVGLSYWDDAVLMHTCVYETARERDSESKGQYECYLTSSKDQ